MKRGFKLIACLIVLLAVRADGQDVLSQHLRDTSNPFVFRDLQAARSVLHLNPDQFAAARLLWEGMNADLERARTKMRRQEERDQEAISAGDITDEQHSQRSREALKVFLGRRFTVEETLLNDLHATLTDSQAALWPIYLRTRRELALRDSGFVAWPSIGEVLDSMKLTQEETGAIAETLEQHLSDLDSAVRNFFAIRKPLIEHIREHGGTDEALAAKLRAASQSVREALQRGLREVAAKLPNERAEQLRARYDETETRRLCGWTPLDKQPPFNEFLAISTLSKAQRAGLRDLAASIDRECLRASLKSAQFARARLLEQPYSEKDAQTQGEEVNKQMTLLMKDLRKRAMAILTADQIHAYEEGEEPPPNARSRPNPQQLGRHNDPDPPDPDFFDDADPS